MKKIIIKNKALNILFKVLVYIIIIFVIMSVVSILFLYHLYQAVGYNSFSFDNLKLILIFARED